MGWLNEWMEQQRNDNPREVSRAPQAHQKPQKAPVEAPDISEPIVSLLKSLDNLNEWELSWGDDILGTKYIYLTNLAHPEIVLRVLGYFNLSYKLQYSLSNGELGFTPHERDAVSDAINKLIYKHTDCVKELEFKKARSRFDVLLTETNK